MASNWDWAEKMWEYTDWLCNGGQCAFQLERLDKFCWSESFSKLTQYW